MVKHNQEQYNKYLKDENAALKSILKYLYKHHHHEIDVLVEEIGVDDLLEVIKY